MKNDFVDRETIKFKTGEKLVKTSEKGIREAIKLMNKRKKYSWRGLDKSEFNYLEKDGVLNGNFVLARHIATCNLETIDAMSYSKLFDIPLCILTYEKDKFDSRNNDKHSYLINPRATIRDFKKRKGKMMIINRGNKKLLRKGDHIEKYNGAPLDEITIHTGENLVEYRKNQLLELSKTLDVKIKIFDISKYFNGLKAEKYYNSFLGLFGIRNIIFENYLNGFSMKNELNHYDAFLENVLFPNLMNVKNETGVLPIFYPLPYREHHYKFPDHTKRAIKIFNKFKEDNYKSYFKGG